MFVSSAVAESGTHVVKAAAVAVLLPDTRLQLDKPLISH